MCQDSVDTCPRLRTATRNRPICGRFSRAQCEAPLLCELVLFCRPAVNPPLGQSLGKLMDAWTNKRGYPVITLGAQTHAYAISNVFPDCNGQARQSVFRIVGGACTRTVLSLMLPWRVQIAPRVTGPCQCASTRRPSVTWFGWEEVRAVIGANWTGLQAGARACRGRLQTGSSRRMCVLLARRHS